MKTVVITGSARGLGFEMAKCFRSKNFNVVISDLFRKDLEMAKKELLSIKGTGDIDYFVCDICQLITRCEGIRRIRFPAQKGYIVIIYLCALSVGAHRRIKV